MKGGRSEKNRKQNVQQIWERGNGETLRLLRCPILLLTLGQANGLDKTVNLGDTQLQFGQLLTNIVQILSRLARIVHESGRGTVKEWIQFTLIRRERSIELNENIGIRWCWIDLGRGSQRVVGRFGGSQLGDGYGLGPDRRSIQATTRVGSDRCLRFLTWWTRRKLLLFLLEQIVLYI